MVLPALWPTIGEVIRAAHGFICSHCIASSLTLPGALVTMATLGLGRRDGFETANGTCVRCGLLGRVIRSRPGANGIGRLA